MFEWINSAMFWATVCDGRFIFRQVMIFYLNFIWKVSKIFRNKIIHFFKSQKNFCDFFVKLHRFDLKPFLVQYFKNDCFFIMFILVHHCQK